MLRLLYGPTPTSLHDYWKNHSFDDTDCVHVCILSPPWGLSQRGTQSESVTLSIRPRPSAAHSGSTASRLIQSRSQRHQGSSVVSSHLAPLPTWSPVAPSPLGSDPVTLILHQNFALNKFLLWKIFPQSSCVFHSLNTFLSLFKCHLLSGSLSHSLYLGFFFRGGGAPPCEIFSSLPRDWNCAPCRGKGKAPSLH